ncbi:hypothetical protein D3C73_1675350 [compost metagenome]
MAGSVSRCRTNAVTPIASIINAAKGPASGNATTHKPTDNGGPTIKHTSSNTDSSA